MQEMPAVLIIGESCVTNIIQPAIVAVSKPGFLTFSQLLKNKNRQNKTNIKVMKILNMFQT